jgi:membrane protein implicated in regulation of membrane protease activity
MLLTITFVLVAALMLAALELWLFWRLVERDDRRQPQGTRAPASSTVSTGATNIGSRQRGSTRLKPAA